MHSLQAVLTFKTTYRVMAADQILSQQGIEHGLTPTPAGLVSPCGLSLRVAIDEINKIVKSLQEASIDISGVFKEDSGKWVEVASHVE